MSKTTAERRAATESSLGEPLEVPEYQRCGGAKEEL